MTRKQKKIGEHEQETKLPVKCPKCHEPGLVLLYDYGEHELNLVCDMREDAHGRFIMGCHDTVFRLSLTEREYHEICQHPLIRENYFVMQVL